MRTLVLTLTRAVQLLGLASALAAIGIVAWLSNDGFEPGEVVVGAFAFAPPVVLWILWAALRELAGLPERLRRLPETARGHGEDMRRLAEELRTPGRRLVRVPMILWRLREVSDLVRPHAAVLPFLSVPFLTLSALAAFAAVAEIGIALLLLIAAAL
jgi:hypothetical protein